jgi:ribosomal-protein-alanine N-acetyltransferase
MHSRSTRAVRCERVRLTSPTSADEEEFLALVRRSRSIHRGLASPPKTPDCFAEWLARAAIANSVDLLLRRRVDGVLLGAVELSQIVRGRLHSAYLGYWIGAPFARQGYMTEGLGLSLDHAFGRLRLHRLEANLQPGNDASRALVERLGFRREGYSPRYLKLGGRWRDHERWAILSEEWRVASQRARRGPQPISTRDRT